VQNDQPLRIEFLVKVLVSDGNAIKSLISERGIFSASYARKKIKLYYLIMKDELFVHLVQDMYWNRFLTSDNTYIVYVMYLYSLSY
jgi:hypothetical protein